jgi:signal transduction histidine kinase/HAMP domain-containing protein
MTYTAYQQDASMAHSAQKEALHYAERIASNQDHITQGVRQLLIALSELPAVQNGDTEECSPLFAQLLETYERYTNIFSVNLNGRFICTGIPIEESLDASRFQWFINTLRTRSFYISDYASGIGELSLVTYSHPVFDDAGELRYLIGIGLDLSWVNRLVNGLNLPPATTVFALDPDGKVLYSYPEDSFGIGEYFENDLVMRTVSQQTSGTLEAVGVKGEPRLFGFVRSGDESSYITLLVGLTREMAFIDSTRLLIQNILGLSLVGVVILLVAWVGTDVLLVRPVDALVQNAQRLTEGDLNARVDLKDVKHTYELTELALAFNEMAQAQQMRQLGLKRSLDDSQYREKLHARQLRFLVSINETLASSLDYRTTLSTVAEMTIPQLGDWCMIHIIEDSQLKLVAVAHTDPEKREWAAQVMKRYPLFNLYTPGAIKDKRPKVYNENLSVLFDRLAQNDTHRRIMDQTGITSVMALPLVLRGNVSGLLTLAFAESKQFYDLQHMWLAIDIARSVAVAVENARLYQAAREQEESLRKLNSELDLRVEERTRQLSAVNKELEAFSYSVSHDLRTPLRAIDGFSQALIEDYAGKLDAEGQDYLRRVRSATQRMDNLINDLLKLSRLTRSEIESTWVNLSKIAHETVSELRAAEPQRVVEVKIQDDLVARGDAHLLYIVMQNLLGNAWKFTGKCELAKIEFGSTVCNGQSAYFVRDNGAGFDMTYAGKLFGAFQRLHKVEEFDGNGIGLATVQRIIHRHGGRVWAESQLNQGATFYFTLTAN